MGHAVALYLWSLATPSVDFARFDSTLNPEEAARRDRFVFARDRDAFVMARGGLRAILGRTMNCAPADVAFDYGPQGKPMLANGPFFNLSHAGGLACLALHDDYALGIDIEAFRPIESDIAPRFFSSAENEALNALPTAEQQDGFFRCWTRKEAVIKALGGGLSIPIKDFDVALDVDHPTVHRIAPAYGDAGDWAMASFRCGDAIWGALAAKTGGKPVTLDIKSCPQDVQIRV